MRAYDGGGRYYQETIGVADDNQRADGSAVLNYDQARKLARDRYTRRYRRRKALPEEPNGSYTVRHSVNDYVEYLKEQMKSGDQIECHLNAHIPFNGLADIECEDLTKRVLVKWRNGLAKLPPRRRSVPGGKQKHLRFNPKDPEQIRRRRHTANILFSYLRAALNCSYRDNKITSDAAWSKIKPFAETDKPRTRYLEHKEVKQFLGAAPSVLRKFLKGGAVTGARPSELARLEVQDYHDPTGKLHIIKSKIAQGRHVVLNEEGQAFFREECRNRKPTELIFVREDGTSWNDDNYVQRTKQAAVDAGLNDVSFYTLRHTYCSHAVMNGMPLEVLAKNLGHVNINMVQKHYGHLSQDYITQQIREHAPTFDLLDDASLDTGEPRGG